MRFPSRFLLQSSGSVPGAAEPPPPPSPPPGVDNDVIAILAGLLCALICVVGLALVARCAWLRRSLSPAASSTPPPPPPPPTLPNKGLKKKVLRSLPTLSFDDAAAAGGKLADCAICLAEFAIGDEVRVLPQCGHGFHTGCVDTWLGSHSSCPSCRRILVIPAHYSSSACQRCGASSTSSSGTAYSTRDAATAEGGAKAIEDSGLSSSFLP